MVKAKHWLCIGAITLALTPAAWADEPNAAASWIENLVAQIVAQITGAPAGLGIQIPVGGAPLTNDPDSEIGGQVPIGGATLMEDPGPGQNELGGQIPVGG